jgi:hypothetical protein
MPWTFDELCARFPEWAWDEPLPVETPNSGQRYGCRICIANNGLRAREVFELPTDPQVIVDHLREVHKVVHSA